MFIVVAPSLTTGPSNITIDENDEAEFQCIATGNPIPKISWINESGKTVGTGETLTLKANRTDSGKYLCLADNGFKTTVNASAYLNVLCKSEHNITINFRKLSELADFEVVTFEEQKTFYKIGRTKLFYEIKEGNSNRKNSTSSSHNFYTLLSDVHRSAACLVGECPLQVGCDEGRRGGGGGEGGQVTLPYLETVWQL